MNYTMFIQQHVKFRSEIPIQVRVDGVTNESASDQHALDEPVWCVKDVKSYQHTQQTVHMLTLLQAQCLCVSVRPCAWLLAQTNKERATDVH